MMRFKILIYQCWPALDVEGYSKLHSDIHFCRRGKRNKNNVVSSSDQDTIDTTDIAAPMEAPDSAILKSTKSSVRKMLPLDKYLFYLVYIY
jgi:hypothetical protein